MVELSVIIPVYNIEIYLSKCLESVLNQTYRNLEIILVDDGSTDRSQILCDEYAERDSRIKVIHKKNGGLSSARNAGIKVARGKYYAFVDSDDWIDTHMYEDMITFLIQSDADIAVCGHTVVREDDSIEIVNVVSDSCSYSGLEATKLILKDQKIFSFAWDKLYKSELFNDIEFPEGRIYEDIATTYKLFHKSKKIVLLNKPYYFYLRRSDSICLNTSPEKNRLRLLHLYKAFYERYLFVKGRFEYDDILDYCAFLTVSSGFRVLHYLVVNQLKFIESEIMNLRNDLCNIDFCCNRYISKKQKIEKVILCMSFRVYKMIVSLYYLKR